MPNDTDSEVVSFGDVGRIVWRARIPMLLGLVLGGLIGGVLAFVLTPIYRAEVVALPVRSGNQGALSSTLGQLSGLAAVAGVDLQNGDSRAEYLAFLRSRYLTQRFIEDNDLIPVLYADRWDSERNHWRVTDDRVPSMTAAVAKFNSDVRTVSEDRRTNVITLAIDWPDREVAADWANRYLQLANMELSRRAVTDAQSMVTYLSTQLEQASALGVQQALYRVIEEQMKTIALANTRPEFAFKTIDPAVVPDKDEFVRPSRLLLVAGLAAFGTMAASIFFALIMAFRRA